MDGVSRDVRFRDGGGVGANRTRATRKIDDKDLIRSLEEKRMRNGKLSTQENKKLYDIYKRIISVEGGLAGVGNVKTDTFDEMFDYNQVESTVHNPGQIDYLNFDHNCNQVPIGGINYLTPVTGKLKTAQVNYEKRAGISRKLADDFEEDIEFVAHQWKVDLVRTFFVTQQKPSKNFVQNPVMSQSTTGNSETKEYGDIVLSPSSLKSSCMTNSVTSVCSAAGLSIPVSVNSSCVSLESSVSSLVDESCSTSAGISVDLQDKSFGTFSSSKQASSPNLISSSNQVFFPSAFPDYQGEDSGYLEKQHFVISDDALVSTIPVAGFGVSDSGCAFDLLVPFTPPLPCKSSSPLLNFSNGFQVCLSAQAVLTPIKALVPSIRPKILHKFSLSPNSSVPCSHPQDQGSNCVSVIIKSKRLEHKHVRMKAVATRLHQVEQLVCRFNIKFDHKSSLGVQLRLDYCFYLPTEARQFFKAVHSLDQSHQSPPKLLSCILLSDSELGYQHLPVLTEQDLLAIQSSDYCRNLFRTSSQIKVVQEEDIVAYHFKSVADVNRFLFNKSSNNAVRSLGQLRQSKVSKIIFPDEEGFFRLFSLDGNIFPNKKFKVKPRIHYGGGSSLGGHLLLFSSKLDLFQFLVSEHAVEFETLQFDETLIKNCEELSMQADINQNSLSNKQENYKERASNNESSGDAREEGSSQRPAWSLDEISQVDVNDSNSGSETTVLTKLKQVDDTCLSEKCNIVDIKDEIKTLDKESAEGKSLRLAVAQKEEEIKKLKMKLMAKDKMIEKEMERKTAVDSDLEEALAQLEKIHRLIPPSPTAGNKLVQDRKQ